MQFDIAITSIHNRKDVAWKYLIDRLQAPLKMGVFLLLTRWRCLLSVAGWPATGEAWVISGRCSSAGSKVGSAPWQFPADRLAVWGKLVPVGIAVALMACGP